ncbi:hypothetical protein DSM25558_4999 [Agrobacterium sp. DSM 25558]|uniref:hypothetical protein n=1 Tax=Agrobacterium sp. DSM 25558 TaxID=1907665 RepID=UPI00097250CD|nr:hypothetical protein [Agrobacterium sp. DSM 25558]SCX30592.1 hypothetical protein DSM25558_4999 [Agrobacterium sp. DSM 25558]
MLKVSALLSLLKVHLLAHENGGAPLLPEASGAVARLLSACEAEVTSMEKKLYGVDPAPVDLTKALSKNVVSLIAFAESRPPKHSSNPNDTI